MVNYPDQVQHFFPLVIDSTMLMDIDRCSISGFYRYILHLNSPESTDLIAGGAFAKGLEIARKAFYNDGHSQNHAVMLGAEALAESYGDHIPFSTSMKTKDVMIYVLEEYFQEYPMAVDHLQPLELVDGTLAIEYRMSEELPIRHPVLGIPLTLVGRADMLGTYHGSNYVADEKTTGKAFTKTWGDQWHTRGQFSTYPYLLAKAGVPVAGALIRGVAIQKTKLTFQEIVSTRSVWQIDIWGKQMLKKIQAFADAYASWVKSGDHPALHFNGVWNDGCVPYGKPCQFQGLCRSDKEYKYIEGEHSQNIWLPHLHERIPLQDYIDSIEAELFEEAYKEPGL